MSYGPIWASVLDLITPVITHDQCLLQNAIRRALGMPPQPSEAEPLPEDVGFVSPWTAESFSFSCAPVYLIRDYPY
jgi:hypothetical protein